MIEKKKTADTIPQVKLNSGNLMPMYGLGVSQADEATADAVMIAIENGYRMIDTAKAYGNEKEVGEGIRRSGINRKEIFLTTKLSVPDMTAGRAREAFEQSLERLKMDYVNLYLLHWPVVEQIESSWKQLEDFYRQGLIRNIGVSNFQIHHLKDMVPYMTITPAVNQIECHPLLVQAELRDFCEELGIINEAWSPLGRANIFDEPVLKSIAQHHDRTVAQVVLRWHIEHGTIVIPKSTKRERIIENSQIFDFSLTQEEVNKIDAMDKHQRFGSDPDNFHFDV